MVSKVLTVRPQVAMVSKLPVVAISKATTLGLLLMVARQVTEPSSRMVVPMEKPVRVVRTKRDRHATHLTELCQQWDDLAIRIGYHDVIMLYDIRSCM